MAVNKQPYLSKKTKKPIWCYDFSYMKIRYRDSGFDSKSSAQDAEDQLKSELKQGGHVLRIVRHETFDSFADEVLRNRESTHALSTVKAEKGHLKIIKSHFGDIRMDLIQPADVNSFICKRKKDGIGNRTINIELNLLRIIFNYALDSRVILKNPMSGIKNLKELIKERLCLSKEEFLHLIEEAKKLPRSAQMATWIQVSAYTGMRPSEVLHLEWKDIDFEKSRICVTPKEGNPTKIGKFRHVPINQELLPVLTKWRETWMEVKQTKGFTHDWVFFYYAKPEIRAQGFRSSFEKALKNASVRPNSRYEFRHFFISEAVMAGIQDITIAKWVGNSPQMIWKHYGHLRTDWQQDQMHLLKFKCVSVQEEAVA
ncbi:MAG TPA: tyrosine-type recombinase/integrase [Saprospiraceae bacterium]|nr:tyrosine-type recombinase/integrase [Saprospiraceae bacterium]